MSGSRTRKFLKYNRRAFLRKAIKYVRRRSTLVNPIIRQISRGVHYFKRTVNLSSENTVQTNVGLSAQLVLGTGLLNFTANAGAGLLTYGAMSYKFSLANLPNVSEFSNLFDSYKILKVVVKIQPYQTVAGGSFAGAPNANGEFGANLHYVIDTDDNALPAASETGVATLQQYPNYKCVRMISSGRKPIKIVFRPKFVSTVGAGGINTIAVEGGNQWLDMGTDTVDHYGIKAVFEGCQPNASNTVMPIRVETTYYLAFKGVR